MEANETTKIETKAEARPMTELEALIELRNLALAAEEAKQSAQMADLQVHRMATRIRRALNLPIAGPIDVDALIKERQDKIKKGQHPAG